MSQSAPRNLVVTTPSEVEIVMTRAFEAPRELVFKAFTDRDLIPKWWGQRGSTLRVDSFDVAPGGTWRFVIEDREGQEYAFRGEFLEIDEPARLVQTFEFEPMAGHISTDSALFEQVAGSTTVTSTTTFASREDRDGMLASGMEAGAAESYERLDELLGTLR